MAELTEDGAAGELTTTRGDDGVAVVRIAGELDMSNVEQMRVALRGALADHQGGPVAFDLADLDFIDSSGLTLLIQAADDHDRVEVRAASPVVRRVIEVAGLPEVLGLRP